MSHLYQHSAMGFLAYYIIHIIWTASFIIEDYIVLLIFIASMSPDFDGLYYIIKKRGKTQIDEKFQHHFYSWAHFPIVYSPLIILLIISLIFNFFPLLFLIPVIGVYVGHFIPDTIGCGDGIMWAKNPFKKGKFTPMINLFAKRTDGYHGKYWDVRFRKTIVYKIENLIVVISIVIIQVLQISYSIRIHPASSSQTFFLGLNVYLIIGLYLGLKKYPEQWHREPPKGRYVDYRINNDFIRGLSKKNRIKHFQKNGEILTKKGILREYYI